MRCRSPAHLRRHLAATLDLTLWCLGCDVRHPDGNLLVRRGLVRLPPPHDTRPAATMYAACTADGGEVSLAVWGFGLFVGSRTAGRGLLVRRHADAGARLTRRPRLAAPAWRPDQLPPADPVRGPDDGAAAAQLLATVASHLAEYERWVASCCGPAYRAACAAAQPRHVRRRQRLGTAELVTAWHAAAGGYALFHAPTGIDHTAEARHHSPAAPASRHAESRAA